VCVRTHTRAHALTHTHTHTYTHTHTHTHTHGRTDADKRTCGPLTHRNTPTKPTPRQAMPAAADATGEVRALPADALLSLRCTTGWDAALRSAPAALMARLASMARRLYLLARRDVYCAHKKADHCSCKSSGNLDFSSSWDTGHGREMEGSFAPAAGEKPTYMCVPPHDARVRRACRACPCVPGPRRFELAGIGMVAAARAQAGRGERGARGRAAAAPARGLRAPARTPCPAQRQDRAGRGPRGAGRPWLSLCLPAGLSRAAVRAGGASHADA